MSLIKINTVIFKNNEEKGIPFTLESKSNIVQIKIDIRFFDKNSLKELKCVLGEMFPIDGVTPIINKVKEILDWS